MRQWLPIVTWSPMAAPEPMVVSFPTLTCSPRIARGAMATFLPIWADLGMMAAGSMPRLVSGSCSKRAALAKVRRGCGEMRMGLEAGLSAKIPTMMAAAGELRAVGRCAASSTKTRLSLLADCRLETAVTVMVASPRRRQPSFSASSRRDCFMVVYCRFPGWVCTTSEKRQSFPMRRIGSSWAIKPHSTGLKGTAEAGAHPKTVYRLRPWIKDRSIEWRLAGGAGFPAAVDPEPLVGIAADEVFDDLGEFCGVGDDVGLVGVGIVAG